MVKIHRVKLFRLFLLLIIASSLLFSAVNSLKKIEVAKGELRLYYSKAFDKKQIKHFRLDHPCREVFDLHNTRLKSKSILKKLKGQAAQTIKVAQYKPNIVRVVISSKKPYSCT